MRFDKNTTKQGDTVTKATNLEPQLTLATNYYYYLSTNTQSRYSIPKHEIRWTWNKEVYIQKATYLEPQNSIWSSEAIKKCSELNTKNLPVWINFKTIAPLPLAAISSWTLPPHNPVPRPTGIDAALGNKLLLCNLHLLLRHNSAITENIFCWRNYGSISATNSQCLDVTASKGNSHNKYLL